jgi:hypothetical protein
MIEKLSPLSLRTLASVVCVWIKAANISAEICKKSYRRLLSSSSLALEGANLLKLSISRGKFHPPMTTSEGKFRSGK